MHHGYINQIAYSFYKFFVEMWARSWFHCVAEKNPRSIDVRIWIMKRKKEGNKRVIG